MSVTWSVRWARKLLNCIQEFLIVIKNNNDSKKYKVLAVVTWTYKDESVCIITDRITRRLFLFRYNVTQAGKDRTRNASLSLTDMETIIRKGSLPSQKIDEIVLTLKILWKEMFCVALVAEKALRGIFGKWRHHFPMVKKKHWRRQWHAPPPSVTRPWH